MNFPKFYNTYGEHLDEIIKCALFLCSYKSEEVLKQVDMNLLHEEIIPQLSNMIVEIATGSREVHAEVRALAIDKYYGNPLFRLPHGDVLGLRKFIIDIKKGTKNNKKENSLDDSAQFHRVYCECFKSLRWIVFWNFLIMIAYSFLLCLNLIRVA